MKRFFFISALIIGGLVCLLSTQYSYLKHPLTVEYLDKNFKSLPDSINAKYYREIRYDKNKKPVGVVTDFYMNKTKQWEGKVYQLQPFRGDGECRRYHKNGQLKNIENWELGKKQGIASSFDTLGNLEMETFYHQDTFIIPGHQQLKKFIAKKDINELKAIRTVLNKAYRQEQKNQLVEAAKTLNPLIEQYPDYTYSIEKRASFHLQAGNYQEAINGYQMLAQSEFSKKDLVQTQIIQCSYKMKDYHNAMQLADNLMKQKQQTRDKYYAQALGYKGLSKMNADGEKAGKDLVEKSIQVSKNQDVFYEYAKYYTDRSSYNQSNSIIEYAIKFHPNSPYFYGLRSINNNKLGNYYQAREDYEYYLTISSGYFFDSYPEVLIRIDLENQLSRTGKIIVGGINEGIHQWRIYEQENPIKAAIISGSANGLKNFIIENW